MLKEFCYITTVGYRSEADSEEKQDIAHIPFEDIHDLQLQLAMLARQKKCLNGTQLIAYDRQNNIVTAIECNGGNNLAFPNSSISVMQHAEIWETALLRTPKNNTNVVAQAFNEKIKTNLEKTLQIVYQNACDLLEDAELLFDNNRISRSHSLAILAFEEFAKTLFIFISIKERTWDGRGLSFLKFHNKKHAYLYQSIRNTIFQNSRRYSFIQYNSIPTSAIENIAKKFDKKQYLDKVKQNMQFVDIYIDGTCKKLCVESQTATQGLFLAKWAFYCLSFTLKNENEEIYKKIMSSNRYSFPIPVIYETQERYRTANLCVHFEDGTQCVLSTTPGFSISSRCPISNNGQDAYAPHLDYIFLRAEELIGSIKKISFTNEARSFWRKNQELYDVVGQLETELEVYGYRYSPFLAAIKEIIATV